MASRSFKKYANLGLEEEKDFFLAALNKRIRNARKKLEQIDELSKKDKSTLKAEQIEKINSKAEVLENIKYVDDIKEIYYSSYKLAKDEGKIVKSAAEVVPYNKAETQAQEAQPQVQAQAPVQVQEVDTSAIVRESLSKVLNLVHLVQFFRDQTHVQEFRQALHSVDLESLHELYTKIFTFTESDKFVRIEDKIARSLSELESYVNSADQPALRNKTYEFLQGVVQRVAESSSFREHKADVSAHQKTGAEHSAIGSELKKVQEHVEAPQAKHASPVKEAKHAKETKPVEATKASPEKEARRDWGAVEDDEEEEGLDKLREEEQQENSFEGEGGRAVDEAEHHYTSLRDKQHQEEKKKVDDEWATVTAKHKEKPAQKPFRGGDKPFRGGDKPFRGGDKPFRGGEQRGEGQRRPRPEGEGENRRPPREQGERQEGEGYKPRGTGTRGGYKGGQQGGERQGGYQKRDGGDEYKRKEGGDTYQKKTEGAKPTEGQ